MSYSKSKKAIQRVAPYLEQMTHARKAGSEVIFNPVDATDFAYRLREGIKASKHFALNAENQPVEPYATYQSLSSDFIIRVVKNDVLCEPRNIVAIAQLRQTTPTINIPNVRNVLGIIGAMISHKAAQVNFPDANRSTIDDSTRLERWADANNYRILVTEEFVTLTRKLENGIDSEERPII